MLSLISRCSFLFFFLFGAIWLTPANGNGNRSLRPTRVIQESNNSTQLTADEQFESNESIFERFDGAIDEKDSIVGEIQLCPPLVVTDPLQPVAPANYTFLLKPTLKDGQTGDWYLIDAIHSNNPSWNYQRIVCKYAYCSLYSCPTLTILSDAGFMNPTGPSGQWGVYMRINETLICAPNDHDVNKCPFS